VSQYGGNIPDNSAELLSLPGIGAYTSRAILAIAFHHKEIAVDGNLVRVYSRLQEDGEANPETLKTSAEAFFKAQLSDVDPSSYNQALMDLGELVCLPKGDPLCSVCPLAAYCKAKANASYLAYPPSKKPLQKKQEERTIFLLVYQGNVALQKRPDVGLLASLYEFPNEVGNYSLAAVKKLAKDWGLDVKAITPLGQTTHTFSHLLWKLTGFRLDLKKQPQRAYIWSTKDQLLNDYSIPSAFAFYKEAYLKGKP
jgi:A/G-specific adenine glycosylase